MAVELGVGYVSVVPSARDFGTQLRKQLGNLTANVGVNVDSSALTKLQKAISGASANVGVNIDGSAANSKLKSAIGDQSALGRQMGTSAGESMSSSLVSSAVKAAGVIAATLGATAAIKEALQVSMDFETTEVAFTGLLGSADLAQAKLKELQEFAKVTPFDFPTISEGARKLLAFGFDVEEIIPTMQTLGDTAAAIGATQRDVNLVIRALGQITSKGRVQLEEIIQIAENFPGVNPIPALAAAVNASEPEFIKALSQPGGALEAFGLTGTQAVDIIIESFKNVPGAMGAMDRQSKTLRGSLETLKDQLRITAIEATKPFLPGISKAIRLVLVPNIEKAGTAIASAAKSMFAELDGVGKPMEGTFAKIGDAIGRFAKNATIGFKEFRDALKGVGEPADTAFGKIGDAVSRFLELLKPLPKAFADAFKTGDTTTTEGMIGLVERAGEIFRDAVDGIEAFGKAFITGKADAEKSGFLGFMSDVGDASRDLVEWLKEKIPSAINTLNDSIDKIKPKLDGWFEFFRDHQDAILTFVGGIATFVVTLKELSKLTTVAKILADIVGPILALGPVGIIAAGVAALAGAFIIAYEKSKPFHDAVDTIIATFKEGGFAAGVKSIGDELGKLFDHVGDLWETWKPKLAEFFRKARKYLEDGFADLLGFEVAPPEMQQLEVPPGAAAVNIPPDMMQQLEIPPGAAPPPPPPRVFKSFGEGFANSMMNQVVPAVGKWFIDNKQKVYDAMGKLLTVLDKWVEEKVLPWAAKEGPKIAGAILKGIAQFAGENTLNEVKIGLKLSFFISGSAADALTSALDWLTGPLLDKLDDWGNRAPGAIARFTVNANEKVGEWMTDGALKLQQFTDWLVGPGLDNFNKWVNDSLASIGRWVTDANEKVGEWIADGGLKLQQFTDWLVGPGLDGFNKWADDSLAAIGRFVTNANEKIGEWITGGGLDLQHFADWLVGPGLDSINKWVNDSLEAIGRFTVEGLWTPFANGFIDALNAIIRAWNGFGLHLPGGISLFDTPNISEIPHVGDNAKGNVFTSETTGLFRFAETSRARPEVVSPVSLMAETFRRELAAVPGGGRGPIAENINITEAQSASAVVDEIHARLGWMLTTRAER